MVCSLPPWMPAIVMCSLPLLAGCGVFLVPPTEPLAACNRGVFFLSAMQSFVVYNSGVLQLAQDVESPLRCLLFFTRLGCIPRTVAW